MCAQTTRFRGRAPTASELDDLLLIELAIRGQAHLDENRSALDETTSAGVFINAQALAEAEGWRAPAGAVGDAVRRLLAKHYLVADRNPEDPGPRGCCVRLQKPGYARAAAVAREYLGEPLQSFIRDDAMFEGIGQAQIEFFGQTYVIGCVEGEEAAAIEHANRFEIDAGEVTKAVSGDLDTPRAMLMAGVLAYERIARLEESQAMAPGSDRLVPLDHNQPPYIETVAALDQLISLVRESNSYREADADDQDRRLAELEAGRRLLGGRLVSWATLQAGLIGTLTYLAGKFADAPIGEAAGWVWTAIKHLAGF